MINETLHPEAEDLTNLIFNIAPQSEEVRCYDALENFSSHRGEDSKADLYSLIAEQPLAERGRANSVQLVSKCLWINEQRYPRG